MIDIFELYEKCVGKVNTHQGGHIRPNRNFVDWVNDIRLEIFEELCAEYEKTQMISDRLSPFLKSKNIIVSGVSNQMWDVVKLPADYEHFASARIWKRNDVACGCFTCGTIDGATGEDAACKNWMDADDIAKAKEESDSQIVEISIEKIDNNRWGAVCSHRTLSPQKTGKPKCTQYEGGLKLAPKGTGVIILDYFRLPQKATFDYTILNPNTETEYIQYNASTSKKLEFTELLIPEFLDRLQKRYGTFVREPELYNQGELDRRGKP